MVKIKARPYFVFEWKGRTTRGLPRHFGDSRFGFTHAADSDGSPVPRGESSWRTIQGVYGNVFGGYFILQFRRFYV